MRRSLIVTVAATVAMVLVAMLVPMAVLVQSYALEDRLAQAALEVQATETVVSGQDKGAVSVYLDSVNDAGTGIRTTVLYPDGTAIGPTPGEDDRVAEARRTGRARVDDAGDGAQILVPVSLGGNSTLPELTPVVRVEVGEPGLGSGVLRAWLILAALGLVLWVGAVVLADRLGRSFVRPIAALAARAETLGDPRREDAAVPVEGPAEVQALGGALNRLVGRIEVLLERERRGVSDLSHRLRTPITAMRLRVERLGDPTEATRLQADLDELEGMVDHLVTEARRSEREGLVARSDAVAVLGERARFWEPLAEDQGRAFEVVVPGGPIPVSTSEGDLAALLDALLDNVFTHTPEGAAVRVRLTPAPGGGALLVVEDAGPGYPADLDVTHRGVSGGGSTGLGMSIVAATAEESAGEVRLLRSDLGGARTEVRIGAPR
ncbi:sensor histidine kinase [Nocardioides euryhalodurans]|uniref:histidine kinase n=1 Tax=Nocardioides euryhalodurans TaxID=2518370 RepID=A0A4P7GM45_9ACTN|nr:ATP-binding protein [Nocardioides euryhalodurans]QBR93080.1 HAMP domain-containing protein [Nocardioides euryhalodurans]